MRSGAPAGLAREGRDRSLVQAPSAGGCIAHWEPMPDSPAALEFALYDTLSRLDGLGLDRMLIEAAPQGRAWEAVRDRLARAAATFSA